MDKKKLIEALHCCSRTDALSLGCDACPLEYCGNECNNLCDTAATALERLCVFMDQVLYGKGLEVAGWHLNGALEPLDHFIEDAFGEAFGDSNNDKT